VIIAGQPFEVVGETSDTTVLAGLAFAYVTVPEAQQLTFGSDQAISTVLTTGYRSSPPGTIALSNEQVEQATLDPLDQAITSIDLVRVLLWIMAAIIIGSVVYLSARERDRDIAVLTAVGASKRALLGSLALQAVAIAIAATAVAAVGQMFLADLFPLRIRVPGRAFWQLPTVAVIVALAASAVGMRRVARSDPALAFAGGA
jgi:putative ABC transport system permease protein